MHPDTSKIETYYEFYKLIFSSQFDRGKKRMVMTAALGYEPWSWRVVGISRAAILEIKRNNYLHPSKALVRDHKIPRSKTIDALFEGTIKPINEWWSKIWDNDQTELITHLEHHSKAKREIFSIDPNLGFFQSKKLAGWTHTKKKEGDFIRQLCEVHGIE